MKIINLLFIGAMIITFSGCDGLYRLLHKQGAEEKEIVGESLPMEKNPNIEEVQKLLEIYGYAPGAPDGVLGRRTRDAIERFQKENGLEPNRFVDQQTWERLNVLVKKGFIENSRLNIKQIQEALRKSGFDPGKIDGESGAKTKKAIIDFQKVHQLTPDGKIGFHTLNALSAYIEETLQ